ncbi:MAG TPA: N,N-dimethylformamidase beta subunit family domain-containing protein [Pseudonocardiaceae bacterium]|nr:N,N-dimethylformamidase beta subunit family domain-containing protein [Pseudonocardiaceae bacterium]
MALRKSQGGTLLLVGAIFAVIVATIALLTVRAPEPVTSANTQQQPSTSTTAPPSTFLSATGVEASWVIAENRQPGTGSWQITGAPPTGSISGYANQVDADAGQQVTFYVSSSASTFHVEAYRIGYYNGTGGRLVWRSPDVTATAQPACPLTPGTNMVSCDNWTASVKVTITSAFVQGDYLFKLVGADNEQSYVPLTVWDPMSRSTYLLKNDVFTWQSWNPYGGYDYYTGQGPCPPKVYPVCNRARVVSFDRPYGDGQGAGDFLALEAPLVRYAEQQGLDVSYATDLTVAQHPTVLADHKALISLGHDEAWSLPERNAATAAFQKGTNIAFFGASAVLRHVRSQPSPLGPDRELVDYRDSTSDPLNGNGNPLDVTGNTWASAPAHWPEEGFVGAAYNGFLDPQVTAPLSVANAGAWVFADTGLGNGSTLPGVVGSDVDALAPDDAYPPDVEVLAHSALPAAQGEPNTRAGPVFYSDMTYYTDPAGKAGVWDSGTTNWVPALTPCPVQQSCSAPTVQKITGNVFWLFGQGPAGRQQPSVANRQQFYPSPG